MDLAFAAETLKPISCDHILARKAQDMEAVRQMAALHPLDLVKIVLQSCGGSATADQIQEMLAPDVIDEDWRKWWNNAKKAMKRDGHFIVPLKKAEPVVYQDEEVSLYDRLLQEFKRAKGLKARLVVASEILKNLEVIEDRQGLVSEATQLLDAEIASHQRTMPSLALEAIFVRDDLREAAGLPVNEAGVGASAIWTQTEDVGEILEGVNAAKYRRALQSFKAARPDDWSQALLSLLNNVSTRLCAECAHLLISEAKLEELKPMLRRLISQHSASSELLHWLAKERSDAFADVLGPDVFRAMLTAIERDQFNEKKTCRLADYIMDDQNLLVELIESADIEVVKDLTRALRFSSSFDDMDKRSLLARIVKQFPSIQPFISGEHAKEESALVVSWDSLERRKREYDQLVHKKIPANSRDIAVARGYGDLSENHEYKAAKEMHRLLMLRKGELEQQLARARGTDFANPQTDSVSIGTRVVVSEHGKPHSEAFNILGAWDGDPDRHVLSYLSPLAQAMINKKVGEEAELDIEGQSARYRIESIEPVPSELTSPPPAAAVSAAKPEPSDVPQTAPAATSDEGTVAGPAEGVAPPSDPEPEAKRKEPELPAEASPVAEAPPPEEAGADKSSD
jgi:transcription elongation GreA/GreB family factor